MVTFATNAPQVGSAGIGGQSTVSTSQPSFAQAASTIGNVAAQGIDTAANISAEEKAKGFISEAQGQVDADLATADTGNLVDHVKNKTDSINRLVNNKAISRDAARVMVGDLVTQSIQEQPFLTQKIRAAATRQLGFDPQSESVRSFFSAFDNKAPTQTPAQKAIASLVANTDMSEQAAAGLVGQGQELALKRQIREDQLALGNISTDEAIAENAIDDSVAASSSIFGAAITAFNAGEEVDSEFWRRSTDTAKIAYVNTQLASLRKSGKTVTTKAIKQINDEANSRYSGYFESVKNLDSTYLRGRGLEDLAVSNQLLAARTLPEMQLISDAYGNNMLSTTMELIASARGKPERLKVLKDTSPLLGRLIDMMEKSPKQFATLTTGAIGKLNNPNVAKKDITSLEGEALDLWLKETVTRAAPEDRSKVIEDLASKTLDNRAISVLANAGPVGATKQEKDYMKSQWNLIQGTLPREIGDILAEENKTLTGKTTLGIGPLGLTLKKGSFSPSAGLVEVDATGSKAWDMIQKINTSIRASNNGWGKIMDVRRPASALASMKAQIDGVLSVRGKESQSDRDAAAEARRIANLPPAPTKAFTPEQITNAENLLSNMTPEQIAALEAKGARAEVR